MSLRKLTKENSSLVLGMIAAAAVLAMAVAAVFITSASAAIYQETIFVSCTNSGGTTPAGQQTVCTGGGLTQEVGSVNLNPAGNFPVCRGSALDA